jgi:hypothetical protein
MLPVEKAARQAGRAGRATSGRPLLRLGHASASR